MSDVLDYMYGLQMHGIKLGLENTREILSRMGDPQDSFRSVHVAGTNGKGSVCAMVDAVLREAGPRTGLYTSPHLVRFNERIKVDGQEILDSDMERLASELRSHAEAMREKERRVTFFEFTTALAFSHFAEQRVEFVVAEVGMGGRLDSTNVLEPTGCGITDVSLEHTQYLGNTIEKVAGEKAGIIKPNVPVVTSAKGEALDVVRAKAGEEGSRLMAVGEGIGFEVTKDDLDGLALKVTTARGEYDVILPLIGTHQAENCAVAVGLCEDLDLDREAIQKGLSRVEWPGRLDLLSRDPVVLLDCAHNPGGARVLAEAVERYLPGIERRLLIGMLDDKDHQQVAGILGPLFKKTYVARPDSERGLDPKVLAEHFENAVVMEKPGMAFDAALGGMDQGQALVIAGSVYLAGEVLGLSGRY